MPSSLFQRPARAPSENAPNNPSLPRRHLPLPSVGKKKKSPQLHIPPTDLLPRPPAPAAGLTSPHQNVRWQNRKAAVCSRHLKVHLRTFPAKSFSPPLSLAQAEGVGCRDQGSARTWTPITFFFFFFSTACVWLHCVTFFFVEIFLINFFFYIFQTFYRFPPQKNLTRHNISPQLFSDEPKESYFTGLAPNEEGP